ncbi:hypothetical protein A9Q99_21975 [Gammaproteobacteria bacterium 45_16_T64]|nr:hypothetical protein A9Q99_21975 [Gammaproteobacteria bacterium 45_16_T64]
MNSSAILWPVVVQVILTFSMFVVLAVRKAKAVKSGGVDRSKTALDNAAWPDDVVQVSNNIQNQFQTPVLFYVLSFAFLITNTVSTAVLGLAWLYVISRVVHAYVHTGSNYVPVRLRVFLVGCLSLILLTGLLVSMLFSL